MDNQIEAMEKILSLFQISYDGDEIIRYFDEDDIQSGLVKALAEFLFAAGYRKIPENAVVLTREDWESEAYVRAMENDLCKKCRERIGEEYETLLEKIRILEVQLDLERSRTLEEWLEATRKGTAEKFAEELKEDILQYAPTLTRGFVFDKIDKHAKQFGVGIKE